jgi:hypothetical protein
MIFDRTNLSFSEIVYEVMISIVKEILIMKHKRTKRRAIIFFKI